MGWLLAGIFLYLMMVLAEKAILAVTPHELEMLRAEGTPSARRVLIAADGDSRRTLAAIAIGRLFLLVVCHILFVGHLLNLKSWQAWLAAQNLPNATQDYFRFGLSMVAVGLLSFVFWRLSQINLRRAQRPIAGFWLRRLNGLITASRLLFRPFLPKKEKKITLEPGNLATSAEQTALEVGKRDIELLRSIAKFGDVTVRQVMQPQPKIVAAERDMPFDELLQLVRQAEFSRMPVYDDDLDNIIGVLYVKDLVADIDQPASFNWAAKIRNVVFIVPETKPVSELLREFQLRKLHMALVVDEYGGTSGLVTLEDILEEVTGEIRDEFDEENEIPPFQQLGENSYRFSGTTMINDVCAILGIDPNTFEDIREDADTIAGLALTLQGDIPKPGDQITWGQYCITIEKADHRRIEELRLEIIP